MPHCSPASATVGARPGWWCTRRSATRHTCRGWSRETRAVAFSAGFWQVLGFRLVRLRPGAVDLARRIKRSIPRIRFGGTPIRDELDLERALGQPVAPASQVV